MCCIFHLVRALALSKMISFYYLVSLFLVEAFEVSFPTGTEARMPMPEAGNERFGIFFIFASHLTLLASVSLFH